MLTGLVLHAGESAGCPSAGELALRTPRRGRPPPGAGHRPRRRPDGHRRVAVHTRPDADEDAGWTRHAEAVVGPGEPAGPGTDDDTAFADGAWPPPARRPTPPPPAATRPRRGRTPSPGASVPPGPWAATCTRRSGPAANRAGRTTGSASTPPCWTPPAGPWPP
ncbi:hypothetical protein ACFQ60_37570 [Streptomyces zhihengii]